MIEIKAIKKGRRRISTVRLPMTNPIENNPASQGGKETVKPYGESPQAMPNNTRGNVSTDFFLNKKGGDHL